MNNKLLLPVVLCLTSFALTAAADTFDFNFNVYGRTTNTNVGFHNVGSGTLTATYDPIHNDYDITAITGTTSAWGNITGLLPAGTYPIVPGPPGDNLLFYPAAQYLDEAGVSFTVQGSGDDGSGDVNVYGFDDSYYEAYGDTDNPGTFTITPATGTPEPASAALLLLGIAGIGTAFWLRRVALYRPSRG